MTSAEALTIAGNALYGPRWQSDLARDIGVTDRTMRRWVAGTDKPRPRVIADLVQHIRSRRAILTGVERQIAEALPGSE